MKNNLYSVEDLAKTCGTTPRAVRFYMEKGLLNPMRAGRTYVFMAEALERLQSILRGKRLGFSLDEIKSRLDAPQPEALEDFIDRVEALSHDANNELDALKDDLSRAHSQKRRRKS